MKKGQVSVFVIVAVVAIVIIAIYFSLNGDFGKSVDPKVKPVYDHVQGCLDIVGTEAIYYVGQSGGYFGVPEFAYQDTIAYYLYENRNLMPTKEKIEENLGSYMDFIIPFCLDGFEEFSDFEIREGDLNSKVLIEDEKVIFNVDYLLSISVEEDTYSFDNFRIEIPSRLGIIHKATGEVMEKQMKRTDGICLGCLYEASEKYEVKFNILDTEQEDTVLMVVRDEKIGIYDNDYEFYYVNKLGDLE